MHAMLCQETLRENVAFSLLMARDALLCIESAAWDGRLEEIADAALSAADAYVAGGTRNNALRKAAMDAFRAAQVLESGPHFHAMHAVSAAAGAAFLHPPGGTTDTHQTKHILGAAVHKVLCIEASGRDPMAAITTIIERIPDAIKELLRLYPEPVGGKQRYGEVLLMLYQAITQSE